MIHCIGDSHVCVFSGVDKIVDGLPCPIDSLSDFRTYRLGPHLAYTVGDRKHRNYQEAMSIVSCLPKEAIILLSYGEIDCRAHILYQSEKQGKEASAIVEEVVAKYENLILDVANTGRKVIVWSPIATCNYDSNVMKDPASFPHYGTTIARNTITRCFWKCLSEKLRTRRDVYVASLLKYLLNEDMTSKMEYYMDGVHLSQKAMPFIMSEITEARKHFDDEDCKVRSDYLFNLHPY